MDILKQTLPALVLVVPAKAIALPAVAVSDQRPQVATLVSSPNRCELKSAQTRCNITINLLWETPDEAGYCLWRDSQAEPLKCWEHSWHGHFELKLNTSKKALFSLKAQATGAVLVQTSVAVTGSYKQRKRAQRRKRGFWRMF